MITCVVFLRVGCRFEEDGGWAVIGNDRGYVDVGVEYDSHTVALTGAAFGPQCPDFFDRNGHRLVFAEGGAFLKAVDDRRSHQAPNRGSDNLGLALAGARYLAADRIGDLTSSTTLTGSEFTPTGYMPTTRTSMAGSSLMDVGCIRSVSRRVAASRPVRPWKGPTPGRRHGTARCGAGPWLCESACAPAMPLCSPLHRQASGLRLVLVAGACWVEVWVEMVHDTRCLDHR